MRIRVLAFATARDALGARRLELDLGEGATVGDLMAELERRSPETAALWKRLALAVDGELAAPETVLRNGCEVALLPPVSGGSTPRVALVDGPIDVPELLRSTSHPGCGATVLFTGTVRDHRGERQVTHLTYEGYAPMAERHLASICEQIEAREPGLRLAVSHRLGGVPVGESSVAIVAVAPHRAAAFAACREVLERLKREVPIWKREHYGDGSAVWREEEPLTASGSSS